MVYIVNGQVVEKKPFSFVDLMLSIFNAIWFFFSTLFSRQTPQQQLQNYAPRGRPGLPFSGRSLGGGTPGSNIHTLPKASLRGGCATG
uniref:Selenoprotein K n=1 Tax=Trypanosoma vivax (strain Y486) TaxID=1055687 RepID=G0U7E5_TRYVY|nr:hypothetical protein TVY486_1008490 [Trypanosoma vivax Y486]